MVKRFAFLMLLLVAGVPASATQPECTGDRHYDGVGCCPNVTSTTTSTTLPGGECAPVLPCPDPAPCQPVRCEDGDDGATVVVDRCPQPEVSEVCKVRRNGEVVCPRSKKARRNGNGGRRLIVPRSIVEKLGETLPY